MSEKEIENYFDRLWPICRSITGKGLRQSFKILKEIIPLKLNEVPSGIKVFDWQIPKEWNIEDAYVIAPDGTKILDFKKNNLHVVGYSIPVNKKMSWDEFERHLFYMEKLPDAVPYVTSYYKKNWGFCISYNEFMKLQRQGMYKVIIKSTLKKGSMTYGDLIVKGKSKKEILFSTYLCHPSMANNELSGPLTLAFLYRQLAKRKNLNYTYRFVVAPETIGAIAYLNTWGEHLKINLLAGYIFTCCGDRGNLSYKRSRSDSLANTFFERQIKKSKAAAKIYEFDPIGSDERQYCSPGFDLPVGVIMRTKFHEFKEYHTSLDNKEFISFRSIAQNVEFCLKMIDEIENTPVYIRTSPFCEPNLGKRMLYDDLSAKQQMPGALIMRMRLLNFCYGKNDIVSFTEKYGYNLEDVKKEVEKLKEAQLIQKI